MKIYSVHYNKPEYIGLQKKSFEKWIKFDFEFIVVNNSIEANTKRKIEEESKNLSLRTIDSFNNVSGNPSVSHSQSFQYILNDLSEGDIAMVLDHDIFLFNNLETSYFEKI